ncbi:NAD-dependent succinate-semialdehyde dehydrogenase [Reinekea blandensis]|uniref:NAD-dependent aldehyde dehydrogenase n=1 Tax=Reinekea blandensis MED297 TaxID=314283 RepID=A4BE30_9GAMM|nr:NAD-dependent succinate-semialdehyde dehydrogenase [Reinekea blandensis]EAR09508.1 NAD-dependent aldehyde dehydrogenase [Reinekea blandensis MED297]
MSFAANTFSQCFINGDWQASESNQTFSVINPADLQPLTKVPDCTAADAESAILAAHQALNDWQQQPAKSRANLLRQWYNLILEHQDALAELMTLECGKPIAESRGEVQYAASFIEWFAEEAKRVRGDTIPAPSKDRRIQVIKQPVGVCTAITPWNFPLAMITRKCAPALAAGCTIVIKPAEGTPLSALALARLAQEAGLPAGIFNVITASQGKEVGEVLSTHPLVRKLSFTGSTAVGKQLLAQAAGTVKRTSMELGGNAPFLVFDDADIDKAVAGAMASKYRNTGQTCVCANRFLVQAGVAEAFAKALAEATRGLKVGPGLEPDTAQGPLINQAGFDKVQALVNDAVDKGATVLTGGGPHALGGLYYQPTVLTDVTGDMRLVNEEIFGPVSPIMVFKDEAEGIALANDTPFGLAAYFYTESLSRSIRVAEGLEYGMVGVNEGILSTETAPFGGIKESGLGREGSHLGIDEYLETKYLCIGGLSE